MSKRKSVVIPPSLSVDPFFIDILSMSKTKLADYNLIALESFGYKDIKYLAHAHQGYIFARGTLPVCLCAHMDKVPYYKPIKKINQVPVLNNDNEVVDVHLESKQGIGGDDRCGVYAILSMLQLGHRPSVLFTMGEETGCIGSRKFTSDVPKDYLNDINAFIQIDRRGNQDCVKYSDQNKELTNAICEFGFKPAYGTCTDISVLMPYFNISGVNLSSGYYNEHNIQKEYVSVKDVKSLIGRLHNILSSDIFNKKYQYEYFTRYKPADLKPKAVVSSNGSEQLSLLDNYPYIENELDVLRCEYCGEHHFADEMVEVDSVFYSSVCEDCAEVFVKLGYTRCEACGNLFLKTCGDNDPDFMKDFCPFCGCMNEN